MRRLVFIDDDETELDDFGRIVGGEYDYNTIHWLRGSQKLFSGAGPDIFVSDLYLPREVATAPQQGMRKTPQQRLQSKWPSGTLRYTWIQPPTTKTGYTRLRRSSG